MALRDLRRKPSTAMKKWKKKQEHVYIRWKENGIDSVLFNALKYRPMTVLSNEQVYIHKKGNILQVKELI